MSNFEHLYKFGVISETVKDFRPLIFSLLRSHDLENLFFSHFLITHLVKVIYITMQKFHLGICMRYFDAIMRFLFLCPYALQWWYIFFVFKFMYVCFQETILSSVSSNLAAFQSGFHEMCQMEQAMTNLHRKQFDIQNSSGFSWHWNKNGPLIPGMYNEPMDIIYWVTFSSKNNMF